MEAHGKELDTQYQDLDLLWNPMDPPASEAKFRALLDNPTVLSGPDQSLAIELMALIARAEAIQGKVPEALATLAKARSLLDDSEASYQVSAQIRWMLERGRLYIREKTPSQAKLLLAEAWALAINSGEDFFVVDIAQMMATLQEPKSQQEWLNRAIEVAENSPFPKTKRWLGSLYTSLGWKLYNLRQFEQALATFQKALRHLKAQGTERETFIAKWSIGKVLRALGKTEEALATQKALLAELGIGGRRDGRLYEEVAECLQTLQRTTEAQLYFELAYRELSDDQWVSDNQPVQLKRMKDLGKVKK